MKTLPLSFSPPSFVPDSKAGVIRFEFCKLDWPVLGPGATVNFITGAQTTGMMTKRKFFFRPAYDPIKVTIASNEKSRISHLSVQIMLSYNFSKYIFIIK